MNVSILGFWSYIYAFLCVIVYYVIIMTFNIRNILKFKNKIILLWRHISVQGNILRPSLYVMPTRIESGIKLRLKLLHW
jgi:hypothetical protein